jgi:hypothetical protein
MTTKFISLATGIVLLDVYLRSQLSSNDPLFLFASNNLVVNAGLIVLVSLTILVSFKDKFSHWWSFIGCVLAAIVCGLIGVAGLFFSDLLYAFPQILMPLDYMFLIEVGIVFGLASLTHKHATVPFKVSWPKPTAFFNNLAFPVPKIPQSPTNTSGPRHVSPA